MYSCRKYDIKTNTFFVALTFLAMVALTPAFADEGSNSPGASAIPTPITPGNPTNISFEESNQAPHRSLEGIYVFSPTAASNFVDPTVSVCPMPVSTNGNYWVLLTLTGQVVNYFIPNNVGNNDGMISVPFGTGAAVVITPSNGAKVGPGNAQAAGQTTPLAAQWHKLTNTGIQGAQVVQGGTANTDNTNEIGVYTSISCGVEGTSGQYQTPVTFNVESPVGGEIISVNTFSLVIAGLTTSGIWIVPTIASVTGIGITLYKLRKNI